MSDEDAIAVVGLALRAPGAADHEQFWANALAGADCLSTVDDERTGPGWVPVKGVLEGADEFDAEFFGYSPREAQLTDPQQRVLLELAWHGLEDAGHTPHSCGRVGVFASATRSTYDRLFEPDGDGVDQLQLRIATDVDFAATRIAYKLDLHGPAMSVQTACSSSLVAVHLAVAALLAGDCDTAIAGGACITLPLRSGYRHQSGSILSPDGRCRAFDAGATGTVPGNGAAVVVLRRLSDAMADGDDPYAVILGSAVTNDGSAKLGFTAPSTAGQRAAITAALAVAGVEPGEVGLVEAHGTGTALGDPIEVGALREVFGPPRADGSWCALSAVKSGVGHLDAAAGIVGLVQATLAVRAGVVPPVVHLREPNPALRLESSPLRVSAEATGWPVAGRRVAGVSAFGVGGTNAHVVVAQAPARPPRAVPPDGPVELTLSARTPAALRAMAHRLADHLDRHPDLDLADVAYTLRAGRTRFEHTMAVRGADRAALSAALRTPVPGPQPPPAVPTRAEGRRVHLPTYPYERERFWPGADATSQAAPTLGPAWLVGLFTDVLGRPPVTGEESFFDLGGDSLMAIQLLSRVSAAAGVEPDLDLFFERPTLAGLVEQLRTEAGS